MARFLARRILFAVVLMLIVERFYGVLRLMTERR